MIYHSLKTTGQYNCLKRHYSNITFHCSVVPLILKFKFFLYLSSFRLLFSLEFNATLHIHVLVFAEIIKFSTDFYFLNKSSFRSLLVCTFRKAWYNFFLYKLGFAARR